MIGLPGPDSELLRTFLSVAEHGNTTKAAAASNRTQSSVSLRIRKLESDLGVELFQRSAKGMKLNQSGRALLPEAQRVVGDLDRLGAGFRDRLAGTISIAVPDDYGAFVLEHVLTRFSGHHPDVVVSVTCGCSGPFPDLIAAGEVDLAIYSAPPEQADEAFFSEPVVWVAHRDLTFDDMVPLALFDRSCWWRDVPTTALADVGVPARVLFTSASHDGVRAAISARVAVGILPASALPADSVEVPGLPALPASNLVLLENDRVESDDVRAEMRRAIIGAFDALAP